MNLFVRELLSKAGHGVGQALSGTSLFDDGEKLVGRSRLHIASVGEIPRRYRKHPRHAAAPAIRAMTANAMAFVDGFARFRITERSQGRGGDSTETPNGT
jgi:hypothetical protein